MKTTPPTLGLHLFFAEQNDRAVILRRGGHDLYRLILWHRDTDRFEDGQWLKHKVYADRCALSPDGRHFMFFALDGKWGSAARGSYTAISQPPYFTALILHPQGDTWGGGGTFLSNTTYAVDSCEADNIMDHSTRLKRVPRDGINPLSLQIPEWEKVKAARRQRVTDEGYRVDAARLYRLEDDSLIRDFTDMEFEAIKAPYDPLTPSDTSTWHPADGDTA